MMKVVFYNVSGCNKLDAIGQPIMYVHRTRKFKRVVYSSILRALQSRVYVTVIVLLCIIVTTITYIRYITHSDVLTPSTLYLAHHNTITDQTINELIDKLNSHSHPHPHPHPHPHAVSDIEQCNICYQCDNDEIETRRLYCDSKHAAELEAIVLSEQLRDLYIVWELHESYCHGFLQEAITMMAGLYKYMPDRLGLVVGGTHQWCNGLSESTIDMLETLVAQPVDTWTVDIHIIHMVPDKYPTQYPHTGYDGKTVVQPPRYRVGRSMYEAIPITQSMAHHINYYIDTVWLPSHGLIDLFTAASIHDVNKLHIVPEPIDDELMHIMPAPDTFQLDSSTQYNLLFSGKLEPRKGMLHCTAMPSDEADCH